MNTATARRRLRRMVAADDAPTLSAEEIDDLLALSSRVDNNDADVEFYAPWRGSLDLVVGDKVVPINDNGHFYEVTVAGVTADDEPTWPTADGATIASGTATLVEAGSTNWVRTYDLNYAAAEGWEIKANRSAKFTTFSADGLSMSKKEIHDHCVERAAHYRERSGNFETGSFQVGTGLHTWTDVAGNVNSGC